jgi:RNA polymerase Rpb6
LDQPSDTADEQPAQHVEPAPPIISRFLFVNVAGQRARQLRRGAAPRLDASGVIRNRPVPDSPALVARCLNSRSELERTARPEEQLIEHLEKILGEQLPEDVVAYHNGFA